MAYEKANLDAGLVAELDPDAPTADVTIHRVVVGRVNDPMTKINVDVREHELPILEELHGADNIEVVETLVMALPEMTVDEEYDRLERKYALTRTKVVRSVYPTRHSLANAMGVRYVARKGVRGGNQVPGAAVVINDDPRIKKTTTGEVANAEAKATSVAVRADAGLASRDDVKDASAASKEAAAQARKDEAAAARMDAGVNKALRMTRDPSRPKAKKAAAPKAKATKKTK
jgi:hypothetical protein